MNPELWAVQRGEDGAVLVRVPSKRPASGMPLPDAVFAFRAGDPQFSYWEKQLLTKECRQAPGYAAHQQS